MSVKSYDLGPNEENKARDELQRLANKNVKNKFTWI